VPYPAALDHLARTHRAEPRPTLSAALEEVALGAQETAARAQLKSRLAAAVASALGRASTKLASRREQLESAEGYEDHRRIGEAILANLHRIAEGAERATLVDYSDPEQRTMEVELDPSLSPAANAQRHFNLYHKGKRIAARLPRLIAQVEKEAGYLADVEGRLAPIDRLDDLREIEGELGSRGYLGKARGSRRPARRASAPDEPDVPRVHAEGCMILYGRNEAQNEHLLRHLSAPGDVWLHVRGAPSGHVIVKCPGREEPPREVLLQAARLAARNSTLRRDDAVEVDYTLRKHVTKPKGSRPGFVRYTHAKTIIVKP
jgi:predicted ribosome quality control (RQC) complex YloA/Tae2 family protein